MDNLALIIVLFLCVSVGWLLGIVSVPEHPNVTVSQNVIEIKDCKEIKIDTISYNYRDSTYVLQVNIK
jgi:hypothetical protein